jgi:hypothetical protein
METRNVKISIETAQRWYNSTDNELKELALTTYPEIAKKELPKSWSELENIKGYYVAGRDSTARYADTTTDKDNKNIFATKEQAEASIALAQLSQLREVYRNGWVPDYKEPLQIKYTITFYEDELSKNSCHNTMHNFLTFQDEKTRDVFLENFSSLIEIAKPLLS